MRGAFVVLDKARKKLLLNLLFDVALPDGIQAVQNQRSVIFNGGGAGIPDAGGQGAGGNDRGIRCVQGGAAAGKQAIQHQGAAVHNTAVQAVRCVGAQKALGRQLHINLRQLGCVAYQGRKA